MKKFTLIFSVILMLGLVSCSKAEMPSNEGSSSGEQTDEMVYFEVNGGMEEMDSDEKTTIALSGSDYGKRTVITNWSNGDEVDFFSLTGSSSKTVNEVRGVKAESIDGRTAKFSVHIKKSSADYYYAVYPSGNSTQDYIDASGYIYATIPNQQRPQLVGSIDQTASPLCARAHIVDFENVSMKFCPAYSLLRIQVGRNDTWKKIEVSSLKENQAVAGKMKVVMNSTDDEQQINSITCPTISEGGKQYITLLPPNGISFENKAYFVSILPQNYDKGLRITFYAKDGETVTSSSKTGSIFITGYQPGDLTSRIVTYSKNATDGERASFKPPYLEITGIKLEDRNQTLKQQYYDLLEDDRSFTLTYKTNCSNIKLHRQSGITREAIQNILTYNTTNKTVKLNFGDEAWFGAFHFRSHETEENALCLTPRFYHPGVIKLTPTSGAWSDDVWNTKTDISCSYGICEFTIKGTENFKKKDSFLDLYLGDATRNPGYVYLPALFKDVDGTNIGLKLTKVTLVPLIVTAYGVSKNYCCINANVYKSNTNTTVSTAVDITADNTTPATWNLTNTNIGTYYRLQATKPSGKNGAHCYTEEIVITYTK